MEPIKEITLDEAIACFEAIDECARRSGLEETAYRQYARYLRRLKRYEEAIAKGDLVWVDTKTTRKRNTTEGSKTS